MAAKRRPDIQLTKDNFDQADRGGDGGDDDAEEYTGPMKVAAEEVLKNRTMVKAKRRLAVGGIGGGGGGGGGEDTANGLFSGLKSSFGSTPFGGGAAAGGGGGGGGSAVFTTKFTFGSGATAASSSSSASSAPAFSLPNSFSSTSSSKLTTSSLPTKPSLFSGFSSSSSSSSSSATITSPSAAFAVPNSTLTSSKPLGASLFSNVNGGGGTMVAGISSSNKPASTATPATQSSTLGDVPRLNKEFFEHLKKFMEPVPTVAYNFSNICQEYITQYQKLKEGYSDPPPQTSSSFSSSTSGQLATEQPLQTSATKATPFSFGLKETSKLNEVKPAAAVVSGGFGEKAATTTFATPAGPPKTSGLFKFGDIKGSDLTASASGFKLPSATSTPFTFGSAGGLSTSSSSAAIAAPVSFGSWPKSSATATTTTSSTSISSSSSATAPTLFGGSGGGNKENVTSFIAGAFATSTPLPKFGFQSAAASSMASASAAGPTTFKLPSTTTTTTSPETAAAAGDTADAEGGGEEEDAPPKVASVEHNEADAVYRKKCRLYYQKEGNFVDKGLAFLYIKKAAGSRAQLLVRSDTTTGNILLNIALVESLPVSKAEKGKGVMLACIPNPPIEPPPKPKTGDDSAASNGDAAAEEANKKSVTFLLRVKVSDSEELYDTIVRYQKEQS